MNEEMKLDDKTIEAAVRNFADMGTLAEAKGLTEAEMNAVYSMGVGFYKTGNYDDAEKVFKFLVLFDHLNSRYWTAMGSLRQAQRRFAEALEAYKMATFLDLENPRPLYYSAECCVALGQKDEALAALEALERYAPKNENGRKMLAKGATLKAALAK